MLARYIADLLKEKDLVIIPDFGAIFKNQMPATQDHQNHVVKPPSISFSFNEFLKYNDGELANYIKDAEKISVEDAAERVKLLVNDFNSTLQTQKSFSIDNIGIFRVDVAGKIEFQAAEVFNTDENFGLSQIEVIPLRSEPIVEQAEKIEMPEAIAQPVVEEPKEVVPVETHHWSEKDEPTVNTAPVILKEEPAVDSTPVETQPEENTESFDDEIPYEVVNKRRRGKLVFVIVLSLIVLLISLFALGLVFYPAQLKNYTKHIPFLNRTDTAKVIIVKDSAAAQKEVAEGKVANLDSLNKIVAEKKVAEQAKVAETPAVKEPVEAPKKEAIVAPKKAEVYVSTKVSAVKPQTGGFYIVAGSFSVAANAQTLVTSLKAKGFDAKIIDYKGRTTVVYGQYRTSDEANQALIKIKAESNKDAWVLKN